MKIIIHLLKEWSLISKISLNGEVNRKRINSQNNNHKPEKALTPLRLWLKKN